MRKGEFKPINLCFAQKVYWEGGTLRQVAKVFCVDRNTVQSRFKKFKIPIKSMSEGKKHCYRNGGRYLDTKGYIYVLKPDHPNTTKSGYIREHVFIASQVLGKPLPEGVVVHHHNEIPSYNKNSNLVICENDIYHRYLHVRMRALEACGDVKWRKCWICRKWDDPKNLYKNDSTYRHSSCYNNYRRNAA